jgi:hypothetical protein
MQGGSNDSLAKTAANVAIQFRRSLVARHVNSAGSTRAAFKAQAWPRRLRGITVGRWHEKETKRFNERSIRRAIVASVVIVGLLYWWLAASIPPAWH